MNEINFYKYQALGNDYIVIDPNKQEVSLTKDFVVKMCDRNFGVGSDGILYGPISRGDEILLKIINPDGSEAEKSGNGIRIFSKYLFDHGYVTNDYTLITKGGKVEVCYLDNKAELIKVDMGTVTFSSNRIPVRGNSRDVIQENLIIEDEKFAITCLSIGNPHCVVLVDALSKDMAAHYGPLIENNDIFPERINVQFMKILDRNNIQIEIWERGAGYTLASGSSSCAAASVAYKLGYVGENINVHVPGGIISINIDDNQHVHMTGAVGYVFCGSYGGY